jgi:hypothetical protein
MPAIKPIVLTDGTTPVTLSPVGGDNVTGQTRYRSNNAATVAANSEALFSNKITSQKLQRQYVRYNQPITAVSADTGETVVRENVIVEINIRVPAVATQSDRESAIKRAFDALSADAFSVELTTGEGQW